LVVFTFPTYPRLKTAHSTKILVISVKCFPTFLHFPVVTVGRSMNAQPLQLDLTQQKLLAHLEQADHTRLAQIVWEATSA
jgi:hypothetical protein